MVLSGRPPLPVRHANPHIPATLNSGSLPPVKYQILNCQGQDILVGRLKIETPTPTGHAFILRRYDTGAISLTTMFRAAFPNAPDHEEKSELQWVKDSHDLSGNNGGPSTPHITRLAGTWVDPSLARALGYEYALAQLIDSVIEAQPDPNANYRRSGKSGGTKAAPSNENIAPGITQSPLKSLPTPSPNDAPGPAKRRKEASPTVASPVASPAKTAVRRSSRQKSPGSKTSTFQTITSVPKTPKAALLTRVEEVELINAPGSDQTVVEEEHSVIETRVAGSDLHEEDIREQKALIEKLKAERAEAEAAKERAAEEADDADADAEEPEESSLKRTREDEEVPLQFNFKEPEQGERAIATNKRVSGFQMQPQQKQLAWGAAAFALGMSAVAFLPNFL